MRCAVCNKPLDRFHAMKISGIIEQITGNGWMCADCVKLAHSGKIKYRALIRED